MSDSVQKLIVVCGPTASGKTTLSLELAQRLNAAILMVDAMAVYRGMDIGTAKPTREERRAVEHYGVDLVDPDCDFSVADFQAAALQALSQIHRSGKTAILVCGTGFYLDALLEGLAPVPGEDQALREQLFGVAREQGPESLHARLTEVDPSSAARIHPNNIKRVVRALEVFHLTARPLSETPPALAPGDFSSLQLGLRRERPELYARVESRVDQMFAQGLVDEVKDLLGRYGKLGRNPAQAIGYREVIAMLDGRCSLDQTIAKVKQNTRRYAKRQVTWFSRKPHINWLDVHGDNCQNIVQAVMLDCRRFLEPARP